MASLKIVVYYSLIVVEQFKGVRNFSVSHLTGLSFASSRLVRLIILEKLNLSRVIVLDIDACTSFMNHAFLSEQNIGFVHLTAELFKVRKRFGANLTDLIGLFFNNFISL